MNQLDLEIKKKRVEMWEKFGFIGRNGFLKDVVMRENEI